ncbi:hypothetical protein GCM10010912_17520 [Paenibacillus albidus]|uniref:Uncharacterized protein n=1 Tax=Paenibacillus albidus TaxID=2041023 RepID=A0A917C6D9_9BACL|nr:hypothetical protein [Paenibacillus albidus]GGF72792.1 hypothetical protein GCM10010912_17520 [Paenibacillus albidus]
MKKIITGMCVLIGLSGLVQYGIQAIDHKDDDKVNIIKMQKNFRAWQGVGSNGKLIYVTTDRNEKFSLSNTISVYGIKGNFIKEKTKAYIGMDSHKRFMSFGDCYVSGDFLYATVYNFNSSPPEKDRISRIVKYRLSDLKQIKTYDIGEGTAESLVKYKESFWVVYHDKNEIRRFDTNFKFLESYPLSEQFGGEGGYQGIFFEGDDLYGNLHGSNKYGENYAQGMDKYHFDGHSFKFVERIKPPTYGSGQGVEKVGNLIFWTDRPGNQIVITNKGKINQPKY